MKTELVPLIIGIGGTALPNSSTEQALRVALDAAEAAGARTRIFGGAVLAGLPHYLTPACITSEDGKALVAAAREADGVIIASTGYHGSISGLLNNGLDYLEVMSKDERVYIDGLPVGLITTAYGWQAGASTLAALRTIVHALRGYPTPFGASLNSAGGLFNDGECIQPAAKEQLEFVGRQVVQYARMSQGVRQMAG